MIEEKVYCFLFGFFMIIILLRWPCFEKFNVSEFIYNNRTKCEQCCNQLQLDTQCRKKCIFDGQICKCCN
jgi:hypothetical protein